MFDDMSADSASTTEPIDDETISESIKEIV